MAIRSFKQAEKLISAFCRKFPGIIKLLIVDRGYIDSYFINTLQKNYKMDILIPLRKNMDAYIDAVALAKAKNSWEIIEMQSDAQEHCLLKKKISSISAITLWQALKLQALVRHSVTISMDSRLRGNDSIFVAL